MPFDHKNRFLRKNSFFIVRFESFLTISNLDQIIDNLDYSFGRSHISKCERQVKLRMKRKRSGSFNFAIFEWPK
jgi:hypothetical protein